MKYIKILLIVSIFSSCTYYKERKLFKRIKDVTSRYGYNDGVSKYDSAYFEFLRKSKNQKVRLGVRYNYKSIKLYGFTFDTSFEKDLIGMKEGKIHPAVTLEIQNLLAIWSSSVDYQNWNETIANCVVDSLESQLNLIYSKNTFGKINLDIDLGDWNISFGRAVFDELYLYGVEPLDSLSIYISSGPIDYEFISIRKQENKEINSRDNYDTGKLKRFEIPYKVVKCGSSKNKI